jgi:membrane protease YdiL (CAAX protease family)
MSLLLNSSNEPRAGVKFLVFVVFFLIIWVATGLALSILVAAGASVPLDDQLVEFALNDTSAFVAAVAAMLLTIRFLDHRPLRAFGVGFLPRWRTDLLFGLSLAAGMLAVVIGGCYAFGYVNMRWTGGQVPAATLLAPFALLLVAALNEELVFRGFPLQILIESLGKWPASIALSALFGALHVSNPNASLLGTINTIVAGILLSLAYVKTRSLWLPYGIHFGC